MAVRSFTVSGLNSYIKDMISDEVYLENIMLSGEISSLSISGVNAYFNLCDANASINCIYFKSAVKSLSSSEVHFDFKNGDVVEIIGSLSFYVKNGRLSFIVTECFLKGKGNKQKELEQLKKELLSQGVFDKKREMPKSVSHIAVITSSDGAVIHDIISVSSRRNRGVDITLFPVKVQGANAEQEIANAIEQVNEVASKLKIDVLIIARGGGSDDDLSAFNTEVVARAVFLSRVVTVSAVGHEVNYTLCDYASDYRVPTPSVAAEIAVPLLSDVYQEVFNLKYRIDTAMQELFTVNSKRLNQLSGQISLSAERKNVVARRMVEAYSGKISALVAKKIDYQRRFIEVFSNQLTNSTRSLLEKHRSEVQVLNTKIHALNPTSLLTAGYAKVIRSKKEVGGVGELEVGSRVEIFMSDGSMSAQVLDIRRLK